MNLYASSPWVVERCKVESDAKHMPLWELILDPSESMIIGGCFCLEDIARGANNTVWDCWTPGMKFRHQKSKKVLTVYVHKEIIMGRSKRDPRRQVLKFKIDKPTNQLELI